jgi:hypothetical protein
MSDGEVLLELSIKQEKLKQELDKSSKVINNAVTKDAKFIGNTLTKIFTTIGGVFAINKIVTSVRTLFNELDRFADLSTVAGISSDAIQKWDYVLSQTSSSAEDFIAVLYRARNAVMKLNEEDLKKKKVDSIGNLELVGEGLINFDTDSMIIDDIDVELSAAGKALKRLGLDYKELGKMTQGDMFDVILKSLFEIEDTTERMDILGDIISDRYTLNRFGEILRMSKEDFYKGFDSAPVISDETLKSASKFNDLMVQLKFKSRAAFAEGLAPYFTDILGVIEMQLIPAIVELVRTFATFLANPANVERVVKLLSEDLPKGFEYLTEKVFPLLDKYLTKLADDPLGGALTAGGVGLAGVLTQAIGVGAFEVLGQTLISKILKKVALKSVVTTMAAEGVAGGVAAGLGEAAVGTAVATKAGALGLLVAGAMKVAVIGAIAAGLGIGLEKLLSHFREETEIGKYDFGSLNEPSKLKGNEGITSTLGFDPYKSTNKAIKPSKSLGTYDSFFVPKGGDITVNVNNAKFMERKDTNNVASRIVDEMVKSGRLQAGY